VSRLSRTKTLCHNYFPISSLFLFVFQLFSHKNLYDDHHSDVQQSVAYPTNVAKRLHISEKKIPPASSSPPPTVGVRDPDQRSARSLEAGLEEEEEEELKMGVQTTLILLIVVTVVCRWLISWLSRGLIMRNSSLPSPPSFS
jgi:hypothetical protein